LKGFILFLASSSSSSSFSLPGLGRTHSSSLNIVSGHPHLLFFFDDGFEGLCGLVWFFDEAYPVEGGYYAFGGVSFDADECFFLVWVPGWFHGDLEAPMALVLDGVGFPDF